MQCKVTTAILAAIAATAVNASPVAKRTMFDVWSPRIISPDADTVWAAGSTVTVIWDTSDAPAIISNAAAITLNKADRIASAWSFRALSHHLDSLNVFCFSSSEGFLKEFNSFSLLNGSAEVTVPNVPAGDDYSITLFGDSGNSGPHFMITE